MRAAFLIEPAGNLNFLLFFTRRHIKAKRVFNDFLLLGCRINKINPNRLR